MKKMKVLVADDHPNITEVIRLYFEENQMEVIEARTGLEAVEKTETEQPDFIILDIMMPEMDGLEACKMIRKKHNIPILMLTAKDEEFDRVLGLELGADDYVTKPFSPRELVARIKAIMRRTHTEQKPPMKETKRYDLGRLQVDVPSRTVNVAGENIFFRPKEFNLLVHFLQHPGTVLTREQLLEHVWGYDYIGDARTVDVHIKKVREKLNKFGIECIHTVWGVGYRFEWHDNTETNTVGTS